MPDFQATAAAIRTARLAAGLSQCELAHRLGWHQSRVSAYERKKACTVETLGKIADALGLAVIVTGDRVSFVATESIQLPEEGD